MLPWFFLFIFGAKILVVELDIKLVRKLIWEIRFGFWCFCCCEVWLRKLSDWFLHLLELLFWMGVGRIWKFYLSIFLLRRICLYYPERVLGDFECKKLIVQYSWLHHPGGFECNTKYEHMRNSAFVFTDV